MSERNQTTHRLQIRDYATGWFWGWAAISAILVAIMLGNEIDATIKAHMSSAIMALMMVMPVRDWTYRLLEWAIDYTSSRSTKYRRRLQKLFTNLSLNDPTGPRKRSRPIYSALMVTISYISVFLALTWISLPYVAHSCVYSFIRKWQYIFTGRISSVHLIINMIVFALFIRLIYWSVGQILNGELCNDDGHLEFSKAWWRLLIMILGFYAKLVISAILLDYTQTMIWEKCCFWTIAVGTPIIIIELRMWIRDHLSSNTNTDNTDDDTDDEDPD